MRTDIVMDRETVSDSTTTTKTLDYTDPISAIIVTFGGTTGATSNQGVYPHHDLDDIRIVDGSFVIHSLNGIQCLAQNYHETGHVPEQEIDEGAGVTMRETFIVRFGRYIGDTMFYLDPRKFNDLKIKLQNTLTISATAGFATGTGNYTVKAILFDEPPGAAKGYFMSKSQMSFTAAASGDETGDFPTDFPYRMIGYRAFETTVGIHESLTHAKVTLDGDKFIPVHERTQDLIDHQSHLFPPAEVGWRLFRTDADTFYSGFGYPKQYTLNAENDLDVAGIDAIDDDQLTAQLLSVTVVPAIAKSATDTALSYAGSGYGFLNCVPIYFGHPADPLSWFDATKYSNMRLKLTQGNAGAVCSAWSQQIAT